MIFKEGKVVCGWSRGQFVLLAFGGSGDLSYLALCTVCRAGPYARGGYLGTGCLRPWYKGSSSVQHLNGIVCTTKTLD